MRWKTRGLPIVPLVIIAEVVLLLIGGDALGMALTLGWLGAAFVAGWWWTLHLQQRGIARALAQVETHGGLAAADGVGRRLALDGLLSMFAGVSLMVPGFLSDIVGLALMVPPLRGFVADRMALRIERDGHGGAVRAENVRATRKQRRGGATVDVDVIRPEDAPETPFEHDVRVITVEPRRPSR